MKVFLDANLLFSAALKEDTPAGRIIRDQRRWGLQLLACEYVVEEARRNIERKAPRRLDALALLVEGLLVTPTSLRGPLLPGLPQKDLPVWFSALAAGADCLLTGDRKDFGPWFNQPAQTRGLRILDLR